MSKHRYNHKVFYYQEVINQTHGFGKYISEISAIRG